MKKTVITILLFIYLAGFGQDTTAAKGFYFGPSFSGLISEGYYSQLYTPHLSQFEKYHKQFYQFSAGIDVMYSFNRKLSLTFGAFYSQRVIEDEYFFDEDSVTNPYQIFKIYSKETIENISFPVHMDYCMLKGKVSPFLITGFIPQFFLRYKYVSQATYTNGSRQDLNIFPRFYNKFELYYQFGLGVDVNFENSRLRFLIYNLRSAPGLPSFKNFYYSLNGNISYYFKN